MENNNNKDGDINIEFEKLCEMTGTPPKKVFEDLLYYHKVIKFLLQSDNLSAHIVRNRLFPNGRPTPDEFISTIVKEINPKNFYRMVRKAKVEEWKIRLTRKFNRFANLVKAYFKRLFVN